MANDYIPKGDSQALAWLQNFSTLITADPTAYGLAAPDGVAMAAVVATYATAYAAAVADVSRGKSTVTAKNTARANAVFKARQLAVIIQANPSVTNVQKSDLGLTIRKTEKTPIPTPTSTVILTYIATTYLEHTFQFADQNSPSSKKRPYGAIAAQVSVWIVPIGQTPTGAPSQVLAVTRNPFSVKFTSGDIGKMAWYSARWITGKGLLGPASNLASFAIG